VLLSSDPTSPVLIVGAYFIATRDGGVTMGLFTGALAIVIFPAPRRIGDSDKYKKQRSLQNFHTTVW
jgi:hypothetical protein